MTGFEPLIGAATAGLTGLIGNVIKEKGGELLKKADIDLFKDRAFNQAVQKYVRRYADRHGILKVACVRMDNPVKLDEIYTAVQLLPRSALRYYESTESLQELFRESGKRGFDFHNAEKKQGIEVANEQQFLMVLGGPGVGKSTFLRKMGLEALRRQAIMNYARQNLDALKPQEQYYAHDCIPVMLELRQFSSKDLKIEDVIAQEFEICGFPKAKDFTELFLKSGKLLVLLDGLDEVPTDAFDYVITEIENLVDRYGSNRFIASCRVAAYTFGGFSRFNDVAMAAFEDDQIDRFIKNWFKKERDLETDTAKRCWELLSSPDYQAAKELAQTPLLLTLLCVIYDEFQDFPKKRHQVYGEALDVLLRKWASEKRIQRNPIYQELSAELELDLLSEMARSSFVQDQLFFRKQTVIEGIRNFLVKNLNAPSHLDAEQVLKEIEIQQGILVERAQSIYSFSHLTFHEYLTAKWITDNLSLGLQEQKAALTPKRTLLEELKSTATRLFSQKNLNVNQKETANQQTDINPNIRQLVSDHVLDQRWREIFLLVAGLAPGRKGADDLLLAMEETAQALIQGEWLQPLIVWAYSETQNSLGDLKPAAKRTAALALALALALARDLVLDIALDLPRDLPRDRAFARGLVLALNIARARDLALARARARDLDLARALARDLTLSSDRDRARARALDIALDLAHDHLKLGIFKAQGIELLIQYLETLSLDKSLFKYYKKSTQKWCNTINLNSNLLEISVQQIQALNSYLYITELMISCKEAAVRVSPTVWDGIESRILAPAD